MLIPVTHPTQCVADSSHTMCCRMCKMRVQRASEHDFGSIAQTVPNSIWPSELHRSMYTYARNARARIRVVHVIGLLHTEIDTQANHRTSFGAPRRVHIAIGIGVSRDWLCDGGWTLGMGQWYVQIFPGLRSVPYSRTVENSHSHKFQFGMINIRLRVPVP